ncbi:MAG TPA: hypothetical protein VGL71_01480 [Urbifossiella sp.]
MDLLMLLLIVVAVVSIGGWGYGTYRRPVLSSGPIVDEPGWVNPIGIVGLIVVFCLILMFATAWRPFYTPVIW